MFDVDTSMNRDPRPTHDELLAIRDRMNARLAAGEPVRLIRVANLRTRYWRRDVDHLEKKMLTLPRGNSREALICDELAATGEHLGLERVGLVVSVDEVRP